MKGSADVYLDPKDVLINVQRIQNVLSFRVLHDPLNLPVTEFRWDDVQKTLQDASRSQLENDNAVLDAESRKVISPEIRVDQNPSNEGDECVPQRRRGNQPGECGRQDGDGPRRLRRGVVLSHPDVVAVRAENVDEREESPVHTFLRHHHTHILDREEELTLVCGERALLLILLVADSLDESVCKGLRGTPAGDAAWRREEPTDATAWESAPRKKTALCPTSSRWSLRARSRGRCLCPFPPVER